MTSFSLNIGNFITLRLTPYKLPTMAWTSLNISKKSRLGWSPYEWWSSPPQYTTLNSNDTTNTENFVPKLTDEFIAWRKTDRLLRGWIIGTLSKEALGFVVGLDTAHVVWTWLKDSYAEDSQEREFTLSQQITYLRKEDDQVLVNTSALSKVYATTLLQLGNLSQTKRKFSISSQASGTSMKHLQQPC